MKMNWEKKKEYKVAQLAKPGRSSAEKKREVSQKCQKGSKKKYCQDCGRATQCQDK